MYIVSEELKNILNTSNAIISTARLTFSDPQLVIDGDNLYSLKIKDYCYNEGRIIGTNIARDAEVEIKNDNYNLQDKEFYLEIGIQLSDGTYEYIPYGYFIVDSIENIKSNNKIKLKAMDRMIKLNDDFVEFDASLYPMTMKQFSNKFAEQYGIELVNQTLPNENFVIKTIPYFTGSTGRQVVKQMAEVFGKFAKFDRTGKLGFYLKNNTNEQITRDKMNSKLEVNDLYGEVNVVTISLYTDVEGENITRRDEQSIAQYGENIIEISENAFLNTQEERERAIDGIFNAIKGFKYIPTNFQYMGRPYLDCGDTIKVQDMETDNFYDSIVLNNYISVPGLRKSTLENKALTKTEVELQYTGEVKSVQKHTELIVDKVNQNIKFVVEKQEEQSQTITYIDNKVDNLKIGATNLLKGTQDFSGATLNRGTILEEKYNNLSVSCYELNSPVGSGKYFDVIRWDNSVNVEPNTEYTLSYYIKGTLDNSNSYFFPSNVESGYGSQGQVVTRDDGSIKFNITENWERVWVTWKTKEDVSGLKNIIVSRLLYGSGTGKICIAGVKLEKGNKASDWSPSPEDVQEGIEINKQEIIKTNNNVSIIEQNLNSVTTRVESTEKQVSTINGEIVLTNSSHDYPIHIEDAGQYDAINCIIEGNSEQNDIPSPEYPSEIKTIGNNPNIFPVSLTTLDGTAITKTNCTAEINENEYIITATKASSLCLGAYIASGTAYQAKNGYLISVKPNTTYYLHLDNELFNQNFITELDENKISLGYTRFTTNKGSITTKPNTKYVVIRFGLVASAIDEQFKTKIDLSTVNRNRYVEYNHDNIEVKSVGKNLFNKDDYTELNGTPNVDGMSFGGGGYCIIMECKHNARYVVQKSKGGNFDRFALATSSTIPSKTSGTSIPFLKFVRDNSAASLNLTTDNDDNYLIVHFYNKTESVLTKQQLLDSIQIEIKNIGENPTEYEEYKESSVICDLNKENLAVREYSDLWYSSSTKLISKATNSYSVIVKIKPNTYYTVHKPLATNRYLIASCTDEPKVDVSINTIFIAVSDSNLLDYTIRTGENDNYLIIGFGMFNDNYSVTDLYNILTCINSYCLYEGASSSENYELVKVNDTFDTYNLSTGIFTQRIGKIILNGSEKFMKSTITSIDRYYIDLMNGMLNDYTKICAISTHFTYSSNSTTKYEMFLGYYVGNENTRLFLNFAEFGTTSVKDFTNWLKEQYDQGNPVIVYYTLKESDFIQIGKSNLILYEGENNISLVDSPIEPNNMQVDYYTNSGLNNIYQNQFAEQKITNESIENRVSATEETATNLSEQYTDLKQTVDGFKFTTTSEVQEKLSNGDLKVELVKTTIVTIDNNGVSVEKDDSQMKSLLDNEGLYVNKGIINKQGNNTLKADINGVETENLYVRTYATLGNHRFEGYIDENGKKRTGLFYQGGAE